MVSDRKRKMGRKRRFMNIYDKKILLVDDNRELLVMIEDTLRRNGYTDIVTAENVKEATECFEKEKPEMAILDIMLPDGDGFTLFRKFRESSNLPILFLSAKDEDNDPAVRAGTWRR